MQKSKGQHIGTERQQKDEATKRNIQNNGAEHNTEQTKKTNKHKKHINKTEQEQEKAKQRKRQYNNT